MENRNEHGGDGSTMTTGAWLAAACAGLLTVLMLTPFAPSMPFASLDGSWAYAMNVATAEHLRFGKDIVFTFGPLAAVYTTVYHPATDLLMLAGSLLISVALFAGLFTTVPPARRMLLLLLPVVLSLGWSRDVVFLFLPMLLPYVVMRGIERGRPFTPILCIMAAAMAILPLVKGNFTLMVALSTLIAVVLCWRTARTTAALLVAVQAGVLVCAWWITGQSLADLPGYFIAQAPIISGYTDAMSIPGNSGDIVVFLITAAVLLGISTLRGVRRHWYAPLLVAAYLFINFKSGFVRHDGHALGAAVALAFIGLLLCLTQGARWGAAAMLAGLLGWGIIADTHMPVTWDTSIARLSAMIRQPVHGLRLRLTQPQVLDGQFKATTAAFGQRPPFAGYTGTADVYPVDISPLLGAGSVWKPRPILQSYSVYTPALARANAAHLARNPPARVYFTIDPIDHRYPSLDDGASWLSLLGSFTPKALDGGYAVLERTATPAPALRPEAPVETHAVLGEEVAVPGWDKPVWVTMQIRPTLAGKLFSTVYKAPKLSIKVRYQNGATADYRIVAGMTETGFLLSPTVSDAQDFVALTSPYRQDVLDARRVVAFTVSGDSGTRWLWDLDYRVGFAHLPIPVSRQAEQALAGTWTAGAAPATYATGGNCNIDDVDGRPVTGSAMPLAAGMVTIRGWAAIDGTAGTPNAGVALLVTDRNLVTREVPAHRMARPDVADYFKQPALAYAGFEAYVDVRRLPPDAQVRVVQRDGNRDLLCTPAMLTVHRTDEVGAAAR